MEIWCSRHIYIPYRLAHGCLLPCYPTQIPGHLTDQCSRSRTSSTESCRKLCISMLHPKLARPENTSQNACRNINKTESKLQHRKMLRDPDLPETKKKKKCSILCDAIPRQLIIIQHPMHTYHTNSHTNYPMPSYMWQEKRFMRAKRWSIVSITLLKDRRWWGFIPHATSF